MLTNNDKTLTEYELPNGITIIVTLQALKRLDKFFSENEIIDANALFNLGLSKRG